MKQMEKPKHVRRLRNLEADLLLNLYNYPYLGVKEFFEVELQGEVRKGEDGKIESDPYQVGAFLNIHSKRQMDFCGRGVGKSMYIAALKWAYWGVVLPYAESVIYDTKRPMSVRFVITGNNLDTAKQLLGYIRNFLAVHPLFAEEIDPNNDSKMFLKLRNGTEYHVRASSNSARGLNPYSYYSGRLGRTIIGRTIVVCDEFAYVVDQDFFKESVEPYLSMQGGSIFHSMTTPNGKDNMAYACSVDRDFLKRVFQSHLNKYKDLKELLKIKKRLIEKGCPEVYDEEYLAIPQDQKYRLYPEKLILRCIENFPGGVLNLDEYLWTDEYIEKHGDELAAKTGGLYLGCDPNKGKGEKGQVSDAAAISVIEIRDKKPRVVVRYATEWGNEESSKPECRKDISINALMDKIRWLYKALKVRGGYVDINPGAAIVAVLQEEGLPIDFVDTDSSKRSQEVDNLALVAMEEGDLAMPPDIDIQRGYQRYGSGEKRTGKKMTDLIKAVNYGIYRALDGSYQAWGAPSMASVKTTDRYGGRSNIPGGSNITSVGIRTLTSVGIGNGKNIH